ncbi:M23 family metallopeptidase [bacterium]|nr:M23 family metallopeptidase [bacterium]
MSKKLYIFGGLLLIVAIFFAGRLFSAAEDEKAAETARIAEVERIALLDRELVIDIESGMTFSIIAEKAGLDHTLMTALFASAEDVYDLSRVKVGKPIKFYFDKPTNQLTKMIYQVDSESELFIEPFSTTTETGEIEENWQAEVRDIDYEIKIKTVEGSIDSSLYQSALDQDIDIRAIIELADVFAWTIDFAMGIRQGDTYKFIYEERYRNGEYVMPGKIIAAIFNNDGEVKEGYYFLEGLDEDGDEIEGYFDLEGASLQKLFLKNPVNFRYISSGYTTGMRYVEAFNVSTGHRAIDYAAAAGTPIRAVGDGVVTSAGWNSGGYGNLTSIRHNSVYSTNYAHQSRIYVRYGQKVKQGDIIGTVGSTGFSTGPHLHFEMVKHGTKVNPLRVELPSDKAIAEENMEAFFASIENIKKQLHGE